METVYYDLRNTKIRRQELEGKINAAARILREGGLVALPTETVYGLGANGLDEQAVRRIFEAKGRPQDNPLILHITGPQWLPRYCQDIPPLAYVLARKFWPGPLTIILKRKPCVPDVVTAGLDTVAVRCPNNPATLAIIREAGVPIAAPSANRSGRPSCTTADDVMEDMTGKIDGLVDGGPCALGVESTILDLTGEQPRLLRPGGVPVEALEQVVGPVIVDKAVTEMPARGERPRAPGMKYRHYAPKAPVTVFSGAPEATAREIARRVRETSGVICFDEYTRLFPRQVVRSLGPYQDKQVQAQRIFQIMRSFDESPVTEILAQCPDSRGLGLAVGNRLKRAAGFHVVESDCQRIVLGITGGTGAGKSTVLSVLEEMGGSVIDCDRLYHRMLEENTEMRERIAAEFPDAFSDDGILDRKALGREAFANPERLNSLNRIVYRYVLPELQKQIRSVEDGLCAVDGISLLESGLDRLCDKTIAVTAPGEVRVRRIMARDNITEEYARLRVAAQKTDEYYRNKCDYELNNAADNPEAFREEAVMFFRRLINKLQDEKRYDGKREMPSEQSATPA